MRSQWLMKMIVLVMAASLSQVAQAQLMATVTASPDPARPGEILDVKITVTNVGPFARTNVEVELDYPAGLAPLSDSLFAGDCPNTSCEAGETATFFIASLPPGKGTTFSLPPQVANVSDGTFISFVAEVFDNELLETSATASLTVGGQRQLELGLHDQQDPVAPGNAISYEIAYGVRETALGVADGVLEFPVPAGSLLQSASDGGVLNSGIVTWALGAMNPGESGLRRVHLVLEPNVTLGTVLPSTATFRDGAFPLMTTVFTEATRVEAALPLQISIQASPRPARQLEILDVEITVANSGQFTRNGVTATLQIPDGLVATSDALFDGDCPNTTCDAQESAVFVVGNLVPGEGRTFSMPLQIAAATLNGVIANLEVIVTDSTGDVYETGTSIAVDGLRELELSLGEDRDSVPIDGLLEYELSFGVVESGIGVGAGLLQLTLPNQVDLVDARGGVTNGQSIEWDLGSLNPGSSGRRSVSVSVRAGTEEGELLQAESTFQDLLLQGHSVSERLVTRVQETNPLEISLSASPNPARQGEILDVELIVSNSGEFTRSGVVARLEFPSGLVSLVESYFNGDCPNTTCDARERAVFDVGSLAGGEGRVFSLPIQVASSTLDGSVIALEAEVSDSFGDCRSTETSLTVASARELELSLLKDADPIAAGQWATYQLAYGVLENGIGVSDGRLRLYVPPGASVDTASNEASIGLGFVEWNVGLVNPGGTGICKAAVNLGVVDPGSQSPLRACFFDAATPELEVWNSTFSRTEDNPIEARVLVAPRPVPAGGQIDLHLVVTNTGVLSRNGVVLQLEYPDGLSSLSDSSFDGDCPNTTCDPLERATFSVGTLAGGETRVFSMSPFVRSDTLDGTVIRFDALVSDSTGALATGSGAAVTGADFAPPVLNCPGDSDGDNDVDLSDLAIALANFGTSGAGLTDGDADCDGDVDLSDLAILLANFGEQCNE